jgi:hypothetical protein
MEKNFTNYEISTIWELALLDLAIEVFQTSKNPEISLIGNLLLKFYKFQTTENYQLKFRDWIFQIQILTNIKFYSWNFVKFSKFRKICYWKFVYWNFLNFKIWRKLPIGNFAIEFFKFKLSASWKFWLMFWNL